MIFTLAQIIGLIAFAVAAYSFQKKTQKGILTMQLVSSTLFALHFLLLGAQVGAILNLISALRALVFSQKEKAWAKSKFWLVFFSAVCITAGILTWENGFSILPIIGMLFTTVAFWIEDAHLVRWVSFPSSPCWWIYNYMNGSWAGVITESFVMLSILIATLRYRWLPALKERKSSR